MYKPKNIKDQIVTNLKFGIIIVVIAAIVSFFSSCSKGSTSAPPPPKDTIGFVQYKVNGSLVTIKERDSGTTEHAVMNKYVNGSFFQQTIYILDAYKDDYNGMSLQILTDSLSTTNYYYDSAHSFGFKNEAYVNRIESLIISGGDYVNIHITSYANGLVSGDFNGKYSPFVPNAPPSTTVITEGHFKNIRCIY